MSRRGLGLAYDVVCDEPVLAESGEVEAVIDAGRECASGSTKREGGRGGI